MKQHTLKKAISFSGKGLHTGVHSEVTIHPAAENQGIKFRRIDLDGNPTINADTSKVASTNRSTTLKQGAAEVTTVEHLLSALYGMEIDNAMVEINGPEVPILDGTAQPYTEELLAVGTVSQDADRDYLEIDEPIVYTDPETGTEIMALPSSHFQATVLIDFNSDVLGQQYAHLKQMSGYVNEIAPCRTFVFAHELEKLVEQDLIRGGALDNAVVFVNKDYDQGKLDRLAAKLNHTTVAIGDDHTLNAEPLKFNNEPARHKLLDLLGDIALVGKPIKGKIVATKPGHKANIEFAKILRQTYMEQRKLKGMPKYDPAQEPLFDINKIVKWLPHRYPFLLVDKIIELSENHVVGVKNITFNEHFFQGHFPNNPVFPGVLQIEAMAQTGGIFALAKVEDPSNYDTYFLKVDHAKFKQKVLPGDTLILKLELLTPIRRGIVHMQCIGYVGNKIVSEAELTAQLVPRQR